MKGESVKLLVMHLQLFVFCVEIVSSERYPGYHVGPNTGEDNDGGKYLACLKATAAIDAAAMKGLDNVVRKISNICTLNAEEVGGRTVTPCLRDHGSKVFSGNISCHNTEGISRKCECNEVQIKVKGSGSYFKTNEEWERKKREDLIGETPEKNELGDEMAWRLLVHKDQYGACKQLLDQKQRELDEATSNRFSVMTSNGCEEKWAGRGREKVDLCDFILEHGDVIYMFRCEASALGAILGEDEREIAQVVQSVSLNLNEGRARKDTVDAQGQHDAIGSTNKPPVGQPAVHRETVRQDVSGSKEDSGSARGEEGEVTEELTNSREDREASPPQLLTTLESKDGTEGNRSTVVDQEKESVTAGEPNSGKVVGGLPPLQEGAAQQTQGLLWPEESGEEPQHEATTVQGESENTTLVKQQEGAVISDDKDEEKSPVSSGEYRQKVQNEVRQAAPLQNMTNVARRRVERASNGHSAALLFSFLLLIHIP